MLFKKNKFFLIINFNQIRNFLSMSVFLLKLSIKCEIFIFFTIFKKTYLFMIIFTLQ